MLPISLETGAANEIIKNEFNGFISKNNDKESSCKTISHLIANKKLITKMGIRARAEVNVRFNSNLYT